MSSRPLTYMERPVESPVCDLVLCGWEFTANDSLVVDLDLHEPCRSTNSVRHRPVDS
jgi:hypothetical protein